MRLNDQEIENVLRGAPKPKAPANLKSQLAAQVRLAGARNKPQARVFASGFRGWLRRWWPALAPAVVSLACVAAMVSQELEIRALQQNTQHLPEQPASLQTAVVRSSDVSVQPEVSASALAVEQEEIARLKERAGQLVAEVARLEKLQAENEVLRKQPIPTGGLTAPELTALDQAREKATSIHCINNLKQIGLAARQWSLDNKDILPPDFRSMSNELNTPKILVCAADTNRAVAASFAAYTDANCSYELLAPSGTYMEPTRVLTRCPVHGHIGLCDGSVQSEVWKRHPDWFVQKENKLYLEWSPQTQSDRVILR